MAIETTIKITGVKEVNAALSELVKKVQRKVISKAVRAGAKPIQAKAKTLAPIKTKILQKSIKVRVSKYVGKRKKKRGEVAINVQTGKGDYKGDTFYGAFQEFGWKAGKRGSENRTEIPGKHYLENAYKAERDAAVRAIVDELKRGVEEATKEVAVK